MAQGWSASVDVLVLQFGGSAPAIEGAFIDRAGVIHLIYFGSDAEGDAIFYTRAPAAEANHARSWSQPSRVGIDAGPAATAALTGDGDGTMVVVYAGMYRGGGLYEVHTTDGGQTWSDPILISRSRGEDVWPGPIWLEMDDLGRVHAVWDIVDETALALEIRYARLDAELQGWDHQTVIARKQDERDILGWPSVISRGSRVFVIYNDLLPTTRFMRQSDDGGLTWSAPVRPFPHVGLAEYAYLVKDSAGTIHMIVGGRLQDATLGGLWYSRLAGNQWTALEPISVGSPEPAFGPCCPRAVVSQGNVLLATWAHNVRREYLTGSWYSYMILEAPEFAVVPLPTPTSSPQPSFTPAARSTEAATETPEGTGSVEGQPFDRSGPPSVEGPAGSIVAGSVPILIIVSALILRRMARPSAAAGQGPGATKPKDKATVG